jgi:hypothetical protein
MFSTRKKNIPDQFDEKRDVKISVNGVNVGVLGVFLLMFCFILMPFTVPTSSPGFFNPTMREMTVKCVCYFMVVGRYGIHCSLLLV